MKKLTFLLILFFIFAFTAESQHAYTYTFSSVPFNSKPAGGPVLKTIGRTHTPVRVMIPLTTCPDSTIVDLTHFENNAGFKAKAFFTGTYSIEVIFKFDELDGYGRIIDFSNSHSDNGIYTLEDCLNFYPTGNIGHCPGEFDTWNYKQIVITRNDANKKMNIYVNGKLFTNHSDVSNYYVIGKAPNDTIKFFRDDYIVPNEASSGNVALICMADYEFTPDEVVASFGDFCHRITRVEDPETDSGLLIFPNANMNKIIVEAPAPMTYEGNIVTLVSIQGTQVYSTTMHQSKIEIDISGFPDGEYTLRVKGNGLNVSKKIVK
jgi:hypothetical protein